MKNPHEVPPTRYMTIKGKTNAIYCDPNYGPRFGYDIHIDDNCNRKNSCWINNNGKEGYECHPEYKKSLFVNSAEPNKENKFSLLDYEVFGIDYENRDNINKLCKYHDIIWEYIETRNISEESLKQIDDEQNLLRDLDAIHNEDSTIRSKILRYIKNQSEYLVDTQIVSQQYDKYIKEWVGDHKWKLLYRSSEHDYTSKSFHEYCDNKGPTLVVIKSSEGWIFGGYTTRSWKVVHPDEYSSIISSCIIFSIDKYKDDDEAFIFTLKNANGVEPTRYMKRKESKYAIYCDPNYGPRFGYDNIYIVNNCNKENSCWINNNGKEGYECHPEYKNSLFVNTAGPNKGNKFSVLDYEVFGIDYENKENINKLCKYPDIIWKYIKTKDISEESLKQFDDDIELLNDLNVIHCEDSNIRLKISQFYLKNPSELLANSQIVNEQSDDKLREWLGNENKWKLLYRASEHGYTGYSFHTYYNYEGSTLIVIKSSGGWIFGGYTTQSWECRRWMSIYNDMK